MAHVLSPKRQWVLLLPLCLHALVIAAFGGIVFVYALVHLDRTDSARHLLRSPTAAEAAGGRVWLTAEASEIVLAAPLAGDVGEMPGARAITTEDPWGGCSVRRQRWVSGKNAAWHDDIAWSWGAYLVRAPGGRSLRVPLSALTSGDRAPLSAGEVRRLVVDAERNGANFRYFRECFPLRTSIAIDARFDDGGLLVAAEDGATGARIETADATHARALRGIALECSGLFGVVAPLVWLGLLAAFWLQPFALRKAIVSVFAVPIGKVLARGLVGAAIGIFVGVAAGATGRAAPQIAIGTTIAGSLSGVWLSLSASFLGTLDAFRRALRGEGGSAMRVHEGTVVAPERGVAGDVTRRSHAFVAREIFALTRKGAVGQRLARTASVARIEAAAGDTRFFVATDTAEIFGPHEELRTTGAELSGRGYPSAVAPEDRAMVRETYLDAGAPVTVVGTAEEEADPLARGEDYRVAGTSAVFVGHEGRGPLVFGFSARALEAQASRDRLVLSYFRAVAGLLALLVIVVPVLAVALGR